MDFELDDAQQEIQALAARIVGDRLAPEQLRQLERAGTWFARDVWEELGRTGLLGLALPEAHGGGGLGLLEACLVAEELGRAAAPLPYLPVVVGAGLALARFGSSEQQARHLPGLAAGASIVTVALHEPVEVAVPVVPTTQAIADGGGWRLHGEKVVVSALGEAEAVLVPARTGDHASTLFLVEPTASGATVVEEVAMTGEPLATLLLDGVEVGPDAVVGTVGGGHEATSFIESRLVAGACAMQTGVCAGALALTASYVSTREQFGVRLGTFQAVGQRVADAYIDTEAVRLTARQAAWRLDAGLEADDALMTAKFWAADGGHRVVHAAQHLHGGIGVDLDYPVHRYFRIAKVLELLLGGATPSLRRLGSLLVSAPAGS
ncbi:MAG: acyl-CoA dehydrogenase family protein [Acidimicrobiia bacterium]